jgi:hypothetical protein
LETLFEVEGELGVCEEVDVPVARHPRYRGIPNCGERRSVSQVLHIAF